MAQPSITTLFYAYISSSWVLLDDAGAAGGVRGSWGSSDNSPVSLLADIGELTITLNNNTGIYSPNGPNALAGWKKGIPFKMVTTFDGDDFIRFRGIISDIQPVPHIKDAKISIIVEEWLGYAVRHKIVNPGYQTNQRGNQVLTTINALLPVQPQATSFAVGSEVFPTAFDAVTSTTRAYDEYARIALSEIGYVYEKHDKTNGETLVFESADTRHGWKLPDTFEVNSSNSGFLLLEDGGYLLMEDGGKLILNEAESISFDGSIISDFDAPYGRHVINYMTCIANPRMTSDQKTEQEAISFDIGMSADTEFASDAPTTNYNTGVEMGIGEWNAGAAIHRSWIKPDFSSLPVGAVIKSATLKLITSTDVSNNARTMYAHRCLRAVVANQATWNIYSTGNSWGTAGCSNSTTDYDGTIALATASVPASPPIPGELDLVFTSLGVAELNKMFNGTYTNNGIILFVDTQINDEIYYATTDNATAIYRPVISLTYTSALEILFQLSATIAIGSGQTVTIKGTYADPEGGLPVNAISTSMVTPVATTDFKVNTLKDGLGTDITANLVIVSQTNGTEGFTHQVRNDSSSGGYITKYNFRGTALYKYNPITHAASDSVSIAELDTESETINQAYKNDLGSGRVFVNSKVDEFRTSRTVLNSISFTANKSRECMQAWLYGDIGQMYYISIPEAGIAGNYYIQGIEFEMSGGIIMVKWIVALALSLQVGLTPIAIEFAGGAATDAVNYGYLPRVSGDQITNRAFSAWVYADTTNAGNSNIFAPFTDENGVDVYLATDGTYLIPALYSKRFSTVGNWASNAGMFTGAWYNVVVFYDHTSLANDPYFYVNGVLYVTSELSTPAGTAKSEIGCPLVIGNWKTSTMNYNGAHDGKIFDPRIYDMSKTTLTQQQLATALYNGGVKSTTVATEGMVFQGFNVRTGDTASYIGQTLTSLLTVRDNMYGSVGVPNGAPVGRVAP
jgi:hypothetical protein